MIVKLNVWLALPTGEILQAGELAVKDPDTRGALQGQFRYLPEYPPTKPEAMAKIYAILNLKLQIA